MMLPSKNVQLQSHGLDIKAQAVHVCVPAHGCFLLPLVTLQCQAPAGIRLCPAVPETLTTPVLVQRQDELMLSEAFHEGARQTRRSLGPSAPLQIINFDWHGMIRDLKEKETVRCLWEHLQGLLPRSDLSSGTVEAASQHSGAGPSDRSVIASSNICVGPCCSEQFAHEIAWYVVELATALWLYHVWIA